MTVYLENNTLSLSRAAGGPPGGPADLTPYFFEKVDQNQCVCLFLEIYRCIWRGPPVVVLKSLRNLSVDINCGLVWTISEKMEVNFSENHEILIFQHFSNRSTITIWRAAGGPLSFLFSKSGISVELNLARV